VSRKFLKDDPELPPSESPKLNESSETVVLPPSRSSRPSVSSVDPLVGQLLSDRYRILERVGDGAMGAVYLAEHTLMHKRVAVKVLHGEMSRVPEVVARFEREAVAAAHIDHPNVVSASDFGKLPDGTFFLVLEYIEGITLRKKLNYGALTLAEALHVTGQIAQGLLRAHQLGIIHRDLKPENIILLEREGDPNFVKILDFGIARVPMGSLGKTEEGLTVTQVGMVYGTAEYMAPEQAQGFDINAQADLYALGVMLFEMLTGWRPFDADSKILVLGMHVTAAVPRLVEKAPDLEVPKAVEDLIRQLMEKDFAKRPADAKEVLARIATLQAEIEYAATAEREAVGTMDTQPPPPAHAVTLHPYGDADADADNGAPGDSDATLPFRAEARLTLPKSKHVEPTKNRALLVVGSVLLGLALVGALFVIVLRRATSFPEVSDAEAPVFVTRNVPEAAAPTTPEDRARAHLEASRWSEGLAELELIAEPASLDLAPFKGTLSKLLISGNVHDATKAIALIQRTPSSVACDLLFEAQASNPVPEIKKKANAALRQKEMREKATPALAVALDLQSESLSCQAIKVLLESARKAGDERSLPALSALIKPRLMRRPGGWGSADSLWCIHKDNEPATTIKAIETRKSP
jgi:eukaryotic-like serine/threonine-protein kinase